MAAAAMMVMGVAAQPVDHHVHERANVYVTQYQTHYVTAGVPAASPVSNPVPVQANVDTASAAPAPAKETSAAPAAASPASSSSSSDSDNTQAASTVSVGDGGALGMTYSPYNNDGSCKSASQVADDLKKLSGYSVLRLYGTDCNQVENVYKAKASSQKLFLGVFDVGSIESNCQAIHDGINGDWSCVHTVSIGNELVNSGQASVDQVGQYVSTARSKLSSLGYSGPVVAVDTFIAVINNPGLCKHSDYMAVNAHAFFDCGITADKAGPWAVQQSQRVWTACGGAKSVLITESGWPKQGSNNGVAVASHDAHVSAINSLKEAIGNDVLLYTAFNDLWKAPGYLGVEQYWGVLDN